LEELDTHSFHVLLGVVGKVGIAEERGFATFMGEVGQYRVLRKIEKDGV
jgi:hypothetical protein